MARMYSRKRGRAGSKQPLTKNKQTWVRYKAKEIELLVGKLVKEGKSASLAGIILRDTYGVPSVKQITNKSVSAIMKEKKAAPTIPEDLMSLIKKSIQLSKHLESNKQDQTAKRGRDLTESHIRRLVKYYKGSKRISADWKYDPAKIKLMIE